MRSLPICCRRSWSSAVVLRVPCRQAPAGHGLWRVGRQSRARHSPKSGDEGIDGIVKEDRLGFDNIYYQAKRWDPEKKIGRPELQSFIGALSSKGLFITTAGFSQAAREYAEKLNSQKLVLVDGNALASLMIDYGVGVSTVATFEVKSIDTDFFTGE